MNHNIRKFLAVASCALAATLAICFAILAWSEPSATPPNGNVSAPINTGTTRQAKTGPLGIKTGSLAYWISQVGQSLAFFNSDSSGNPKAAQMVIGQDGNVGIGTTVPDKKLVVGGAAQANQFCLNGKCCSSWEECGAGSGAATLGPVSTIAVSGYTKFSCGATCCTDSGSGCAKYCPAYGDYWCPANECIFLTRHGNFCASNGYMMVEDGAVLTETGEGTTGGSGYRTWAVYAGIYWNTASCSNAFFSPVSQKSASYQYFKCSSSKWVSLVCIPNVVDNCRVCNSDGSAWVDYENKCAAGQQCRGGICGSDKCAKGQTQTKCGTAYKVYTNSCVLGADGFYDWPSSGWSLLKDCGYHYCAGSSSSCTTNCSAKCGTKSVY